jgi:hypothetical protein
MLNFSESFAKHPYYIIPVYTLALDFDDYSYMVKLYGERHAFDLIKTSREYKKFFNGLSQINMWPLIVNYDGYIEDTYFSLAAAISSDFKEMSYLQRKQPSPYFCYDLNWAKETFTNVDKILSEYDRLLKKLN